MNKILDNHINDPLEIIELNINNKKFPRINTITQEEYDLIAIKDNYTIYSITGENKLYLGDKLIPKENNDNKYLIGPANEYGEYSLYLYTNYNLIELYKFNNIQNAINILNRINHIGSHDDIKINIFNILIKYIDRILTVNETIIGILSMFGYKNNPRLQRLISILSSKEFIPNRNLDYKINIDNRILNILLNDNDVLCQYAYKIYNIFTLSNYFKDNKYQKRNDDDIDLSDQISKIYNIIMK